MDVVSTSTHMTRLDSTLADGLHAGQEILSQCVHLQSSGNGLPCMYIDNTKNICACGQRVLAKPEAHKVVKVHRGMRMSPILIASEQDIYIYI